MDDFKITYECTHCESICEVTMIRSGKDQKPHQCVYNWDNDCDVKWKEKSIKPFNRHERLLELQTNIEALLEEN